MTSRNTERRPIVIRVSIAEPDPLSGTVAAESGKELPFEGWLGLLGVLSKLVGSAGDTDNRSEEPPNDEF